MEGDDPSDCLYWVNVRRDGKADLFGDRRMVETTDCFVGEPVATQNAGKLEEDIGLGTDDPPGRPRMS